MTAAHGGVAHVEAAFTAGAVDAVEPLAEGRQSAGPACSESGVRFDPRHHVLT
jgi:hypothetical protein